METKNKAGKEGMANGTTAHSMRGPLSERDLRNLIDNSAMEGVVGACAAFLNARKVECTTNTMLAFADKLTVEFKPGQPPSVLPKSIKFYIDTGLSQAMETIYALNREGDIENLIKLVRVIAQGELLLILDSFPGKAIELLHSCEKQKNPGTES